MKQKRIYVMNTWRGKKVIKRKLCKYCSNHFRRTLKNTKVFNVQRFCDRKCWKKWFKGRNHHQWKTRKRRECIDCKKEIERHSIKRCRKCYNNFLRSQNGSRHFWYKHGLSKTREYKQLTEAKRRALKIKKWHLDFGKKDWDEIKKRSDYRCNHCHRRTRLTIDHIIPLSKGGIHSKENIQALCIHCNSSKSNK